ncbi:MULTISPECIES: DUF3422 domain-containing protein [Ramlibacter]|uniref:DUF3422 domain-containing protein n=1 Tax=Ramlibacter aquaticus TaxID=2780094 RepID=A0ABR9SHE0_9BURK|nr:MULTISPECIES: DUF3422 domain-containing protein [Ramlibacter]MBE7941769.1 DUF3422 domain-containing protein [Ramlibacter aquaticus]
MPQTHPQRTALHNELHARPPEPVAPPLAVTHIVMAAQPQERAASREHLGRLLHDHHLPAPDEGITHLRTALGVTRLRWELHTEFVSWTFSQPFDLAGFNANAPPTGLRAVPEDWLATLPGQQLVAIHLWVLPPQLREDLLARELLHEDTVVGSSLLHGQLEAYTDFAIHADGFSRMAVYAGSQSSSPRVLGRLVQHLLEIDTYRMAALLGLPMARESAASLGEAERELAELAGAIREAAREEEPQLLDRLTRLAGEVESRYAATHSRFSASAAYFELVDQRVREIDESPIPGLQTIGEFIERRMSPARATCAWVARRENALSERVSRISNLLRTRVEIEQQEGTQALLSAMNKRMSLQLKLQATVEGLSVAAITYYAAGLVSYLARGAVALGWPLKPDMTAAVAVPLIALGVWASMRRMHHKLFQMEDRTPD